MVDYSSLHPPPTLWIPRVHYSEMLAHLGNEFPFEGCGLLAGKNGRVLRLFAIGNILKSPIAYEMDPQQQLDAMLKMEESGCELLAIYHSHPGGPGTPSTTDILKAYYPEAAHVIVSYQTRKHPKVRAFTIVHNQVEEIPIEIV